MMLTPKRLAAVRGEAAAISECHPSKDARAFAKSALAVLDAQQARIAELEENAEAHVLAMKAGKAMLQAETERADNAEARAERECAQNTSLLYLLAKIREACGDNGKRMQDELVAYIGGLHQDATSLRIFAAKVAKQKPEKPDYWSSCGQCERNASEAEDLIEVAPAVWPEDTSDYGSRIAVIGQNGATGDHYPEQKL